MGVKIKVKGRKKCYNKCKVVILRVYDDDLEFLESRAKQNNTTIPKIILQFVKEKNVKHSYNN